MNKNLVKVLLVGLVVVSSINVRGNDIWNNEGKDESINWFPAHQSTSLAQQRGVPDCEITEPVSLPVGDSIAIPLLFLSLYCIIKIVSKKKKYKYYSRI